MSGETKAGTPGALIRQARQGRGWSVDELAARTRIPAAMLAAIEADEYHRLSGPLYARSFLQSCAKELGLDPAVILESYSREAGEPARTGIAPLPVQERVQIRRVGLPWGRVALVAVIVAALGTGAVVALRGDGREQDAALLAAADAGARPGMVARAADPAPALPGGEGEGGGSATGEGGAAPEGQPGMAFADGLAWPLVARLRVAEPGIARARRDGEAEYIDAAWPGGYGAAPVPAGGVVAGRAYADGAALVVYWGAVERLSLVLGDLPGAELTVNGRPWPLAPPAQGGEFVVDVDTGSGPLP